LSERDYAGAQAYYNRLISLIAENDMQHSAQSLWQGIRIANYYNNPEQVESIGALLGELYPDSDEYRRYTAMKARG
jgi:type IV pilus assembly protein PilF